MDVLLGDNKQLGSTFGEAVGRLMVEVRSLNSEIAELQNAIVLKDKLL